MLLRNIDLRLGQQVEKKLLPHRAQVAGDDLIVVIRLPAEILQMLPERIRGSRSHTGSHIHRIF